MQMNRSKWFQPLFAVGLGLLFLAAMWIGGDPRGGLYSLAVMVAFGALILFGVASLHPPLRHEGCRPPGRYPSASASASPFSPSA